MTGISKEFCVDDVLLNSCLSLFTNMRSKSEGRFLGQGLWSNLFYSSHINYAIAVLSIYSAWLIVFAVQKVGWNVRGVKCPWGETYVEWNVFGVKCTGVKCPGVKCLRGEMSWHHQSWVFWNFGCYGLGYFGYFVFGYFGLGYFGFGCFLLPPNFTAMAITDSAICISELLWFTADHYWQSQIVGN